MNTQIVKKATVELDENQLLDVLITMNNHYRNHPNRESRNDLKEIIRVLSDALDEIL